MEDDSGVTQTQTTALKPNYYKSKAGKEVWDVVAEFNLNYFIGNVFKYIVRASRRAQDPARQIEDLEKAIAYIKKQIDLIRG
jgi:hypothetical protein